MYDKEDRLLISRAPAPSVGGPQLVSEFTYDQIGNTASVKDPNSQVTRYSYR